MLPTLVVGVPPPPGASLSLFTLTYVISATQTARNAETHQKIGAGVLQSNETPKRFPALPCSPIGFPIDTFDPFSETSDAEEFFEPSLFVASTHADTSFATVFKRKDRFSRRFYFSLVKPAFVPPVYTVQGFPKRQQNNHEDSTEFP